MHDVHACWKHGIRKRNKKEHKSGKLFSTLFSFLVLTFALMLQYCVRLSSVCDVMYCG